VRQAVTEIDGCDEDVFRIVRASMRRLHPEQAARVLDGIGPSEGPPAVIGMLTLLDRIDALEKSKSKADHAAVATLATRGLDKKERERLRALVVIAMKGTDETEPKVDPAATKRTEDRQRALEQLRAWYEDWSDMAKSVIKRKDRLIRLGLAKRKVKSAVATAPTTTAPAKTPANGATVNSQA
jgi:hypothetical protein